MLKWTREMKQYGCGVRNEIDWQGGVAVYPYLDCLISLKHIEFVNQWLFMLGQGQAEQYIR